MDISNKLRTVTSTKQTFEDSFYHNLSLKTDVLNNLITFKFMLPFRFPVKQYTRIKLKNYLLTILHRSENSDIDNYNNGKVYSNIEITKSINEAHIKKYRNNRYSQNNKFLTEIFDEMLKELNRFIKIIMINKVHTEIYPVGLIDIKTIPYYEIYESSINSQNILFSGVLHLPQKINIKDDLSYEEINRCLIQFEFQFENKKIEDNPMFGVQYYLKLAQLNQINHMWNEAILYYNISFEMFITQIVRLYYKDYEKKETQKINRILEAGQKNLINDHFKKKVVKNFISYDNQKYFERLLELYNDKVYKERNGFVHSGISTNEDYTRIAFSILTGMLSLFVYDINISTKQDDFTTNFKKAATLGNNLAYENIIELINALLEDFNY